jgi:diketogulonate reductase-like aldo/keto reductase
MHTVDANSATIPALGFGTWELRGDTARRMVEAALAIGYRHLDTAQMYGNEAAVGAALRGSGLPRGDVFVTTKVWPDRFRAGDLQRSVEESLARLRLDRVDLLLLHWPSPTVPLAETMDALNDVAARGWAAHIGISNFTGELLERAVALSERPLVTNQVEYHPFQDQSALLADCRRRGLSVTAYRPLARGRVFDDPVLAGIARSHGRTPGQVALRWLVQQDGVIAIPRSSKPGHARDNFGIDGFALDEREMAEIATLASPRGPA